jgi:hypothetical protein
VSIAVRRALDGRLPHDDDDYDNVQEVDENFLDLTLSEDGEEDDRQEEGAGHDTPPPLLMPQVHAASPFAAEARWP